MLKDTETTLKPLFYYAPAMVICAALLGVTAFLTFKKISERDKVKEFKEIMTKYEDDVAIYENKKEEYKALKEKLKAEGILFFENQNGIYEAD